MSADNWVTCPRCLARERAKLEGRRKEVADAYGKVDQAAYALLVVALEQEETKGAESRAGETFREDWEIGLTLAGRFYVRYQGHCTTKGCGLSHELEFEPELKVGVPLTPAQNIGNQIAAALLELGEALPVAEEPDEA